MKLILIYIVLSSMLVNAFGANFCNSYKPVYTTTTNFWGNTIAQTHEFDLYASAYTTPTSNDHGIRITLYGNPVVSWNKAIVKFIDSNDASNTYLLDVAAHFADPNTVPPSGAYYTILVEDFYLDNFKVQVMDTDGTTRREGPWDGGNQYYRVDCKPVKFLECDGSASKIYTYSLVGLRKTFPSDKDVVIRNVPESLTNPSMYNVLGSFSYNSLERSYPDTTSMYVTPLVGDGVLTPGNNLAVGGVAEITDAVDVYCINRCGTSGLQNAEGTCVACEDNPGFALNDKHTKCQCDALNKFVSDGADGCVCDANDGYGTDGADGCQACSGVLGSTGLANSDGSCVCDASNNFVSDGAGGCQCDSSNNFVSDGDGGCQACSNVEGSTGLANSGGCVCDVENGYGSNDAGGCQCDASKGFVSDDVNGGCQCVIGGIYIPPTTSCYKLVNEDHFCNKEDNARNTGMKQVYESDGTNPSTAERCFQRCIESNQLFTFGNANSFHWENDGTLRCFCNLNDCDVNVVDSDNYYDYTYQQYYPIYNAYAISYGSDCAATSNPTTIPIDGFCTCDASNNFVSDGAGGCQCDSSNNFVSDGDGGCQPCSDVTGSTGSATSDGLCVCDATSGYISDGEGGCNQCGTNTGELSATASAILDTCVCNIAQNYYNDFTGTQCILQVTTDGWACQSSSVGTITRGIVNINTNLNIFVWCQAECGEEYPFELQDYSSTEKRCVCSRQSECTPTFDLSATPYYMIGECNFNEETPPTAIQSQDGILGSKVVAALNIDASQIDCAYCDASKNLRASSNGDKCHCDATNNFIPDGDGCHQCLADETVSSDGTACECSEDNHFGVGAGCEPCDDNSENTVRGTELCYDFHGESRVESINKIQAIQNSLSTIQQTTGECPLNE